MDNPKERRGVALIGCGAIAGSFHLPAIARRPALLRELVLVDPDLDRARALGRAHGIERVAASYEELLPGLRGAIVATPHALHHRVALDCVRHGVHVLCEKPLAETAAQVRELAAVAGTSGARILVNNTRRLVPAYREVARMIRAGELGAIRRMEFREGDRFDWPAVSGSQFGRASGGRGVLFDIGAHVLDLACWWLDSSPRMVRYADDSFGGSEAVARLEFHAGDCRGRVELSWISRLENDFVVEGSDGSLGGGIYDWTTLWHTAADGRRRRIRLPDGVSVYADLAHVLLENFEDVLHGRAEPLVSAADVLPSIELLEAAYAVRTRLDMPWFPFAAAPEAALA
jgi:predicted dehydrogenase